MQRSAWAAPVSTEEAHRRAAGRKAFNAKRKLLRDLRRAELLALLATGSVRLAERGAVMRLAERLGVHHSVASRDLSWVFSLDAPRCRCCGRELAAREE